MAGDIAHPVSFSGMAPRGPEKRNHKHYCKQNERTYCTWHGISSFYLERNKGL